MKVEIPTPDELNDFWVDQTLGSIITALVREIVTDFHYLKDPGAALTYPMRLFLPYGIMPPQEYEALKDSIAETEKLLAERVVPLFQEKGWKATAESGKHQGYTHWFIRIERP